MTTILASSLPLLLAATALLQGAQEGPKTIGRQWTLYHEGNGIEAVAKDIHVWQSGDGLSPQHAYGVARLDFLKNTAEYEIEFRVRFGANGELPARLELWSGGKKPLSIVGGGDANEIRFEASGQRLKSEPYDQDWRAVKIVGTPDSIKVIVYGKEIGTAPASSLPDILVFGSPSTELGRQTEAWLRLDKISFRVADPTAPIDPRILVAQMTILRQRQNTDPASASWRWVSLLSITNNGKFPIDIAALPELRIMTVDYAEFVLRPVRSLDGPDALLPIESGSRMLAPGESVEVTFASNTLSQAPSTRPTRAELGPLGKAQILELPPP